MKQFIRVLGILTLTTAAAAFFGCSKTNDDHAGHDHAAHQTKTTSRTPAPAGEGVIEQTMCPVMNAPINKDIFVEYEGKKGYFCCPGCPEEFQKTPEKYLANLPQFKK
jgi:YHS domain-containing protein